MPRRFEAFHGVSPELLLSLDGSSLIRAVGMSSGSFSRTCALVEAEPEAVEVSPFDSSAGSTSMAFGPPASFAASTVGEERTRRVCLMLKEALVVPSSARSSLSASATAAVACCFSAAAFSSACFCFLRSFFLCVLVLGASGSSEVAAGWARGRGAGEEPPALGADSA